MEMECFSGSCFNLYTAELVLNMEENDMKGSGRLPISPSV